MLYLDYSANTPVDEEVLQCFCEAERRYPGNANAHHQAGTTAKAAINEATGSIARCLGAPPRASSTPPAQAKPTTLP